MDHKWIIAAFQKILTTTVGNLHFGKVSSVQGGTNQILSQMTTLGLLF